MWTSKLGGNQNLGINYDITGNITSRSDVAGGATWTYDPVRKHAVTQAGSSAFQTQLGLWMGLNHMNGRVQDAITGRFLSADPVIPDTQDTQSYNRYSYVNNRPLSYVDPSGFDDACSDTGNNDDPDTGGGSPDPTPPQQPDSIRTHAKDQTTCSGNSASTAPAGAFPKPDCDYSGCWVPRQICTYLECNTQWDFYASQGGLLVIQNFSLGAAVGPGDGGRGAPLKQGAPQGNPYGKCLSNVQDFINAHAGDAGTLASQLGNGVTAAEVLATAGNETGWGGGFASFGNYFGLHGNGPAGTYYTTKNHTPVQMFSGPDTFMSSGEEFVSNISPYLSPGMGQNPLGFFSILNQHGYATGNSGYPAAMVQTGSNRGPYTLAMACMAGQ